MKKETGKYERTEIIESTSSCRDLHIEENRIIFLRKGIISVYNRKPKENNQEKPKNQNETLVYGKEIEYNFFKSKKYQLNYGPSFKETSMSVIGDSLVFNHPFVICNINDKNKTVKMKRNVSSNYYDLLAVEHDLSNVVIVARNGLSFHPMDTNVTKPLNPPVSFNGRAVSYTFASRLLFYCYGQSNNKFSLIVHCWKDDIKLIDSSFHPSSKPSNKSSPSSTTSSTSPTNTTPEKIVYDNDKKCLIF